jgi:hypothetical protein
VFAHRIRRGKQMTKTQAISEIFLTHFAATGSVKQAFEKTFGEGSYEKFAGEMYDALRAKSEG